jgi:hydrogenase/urease accessory protein HupE
MSNPRGRLPPERPIEAAIAASVIVAGIISLFPRLARRGTLLAFAFGLLHGFGFANVLRELEVSADSLAWPGCRSRSRFSLGRG